MKFRPYHNPENIDESHVPDGWRFAYADEIKNNSPSLRWRRFWVAGAFSDRTDQTYGIHQHLTYIVPAWAYDL